MSDINVFFNEKHNPIEFNGLLLSVIIIIGCMLKEFNLPGANIMLIIGFGWCCTLFIPYFIFLLLKEKKIIEVIAVFFFNTLMLGLWFKIMKWPFVDFLITWSLTISVFGVIPVYIISNYLKKVNEDFTKENRKKNIIIGTLYFAFISSFYLIMR